MCDGFTNNYVHIHVATAVPSLEWNCKQLEVLMKQYKYMCACVTSTSLWSRANSCVFFTTGMNMYTAVVDKIVLLA